MHAASAADAHAAGRAGEAWEALRTWIRRDRRERVLLLAGPDGRAAALWPYSQVLHAAVLADALGIGQGSSGDLIAGLESYRSGAAYAAGRRPSRRTRYYDDNAWVGLAAAQSWLIREVPQDEDLALASRLLGWVRSGEAPSGGVRWREGQAALHACSTGAVGLLALRVSAPDLALARRCRDFLAGPLLRADGLVADHVDARGRVEPTTWSYNQGLAVGLDVLLHRSGEPGSLVRARQLADRACRYLSADDRLWREPPCFVGVFLRMLLLLHSEDGDPRWPATATAYVDRVWAEARTPEGRFDGGGIGAYGTQRTLDLAGISQVATLLASPAAVRRLIC